MKTFLIILAVIVLIFALVFSIRATFTVIQDKKTTAKVRVLFWEFEIDLIKIISSVLFPEQKASEVRNQIDEKKSVKAEKKAEKNVQPSEPEPAAEQPAQNSQQISEKAKSTGEKTGPAKYIKDVYDKDGILGILDMVQTVYLSLEAAVKKFFKCFHIHSLYVRITVGGADAYSISRSVGKICSIYYPLIGAVLNGMKVDNYNHSIQPDYLSEQTESEVQFIASISVGNLLGIVLSAGKVFLVNLIKNK